MKSQYAFALLTLLPLLYVLSTGPVLMMDRRMNKPAWGIPSTGVLTFYKPLVWLCDHVTPIGFAIEKYVHLWLPPEPAS